MSEAECKHFVSMEDWGSEHCSACGQKLSCEGCAWFTGCLAAGGCVKAMNEQRDAHQSTGSKP